MTGDRISATRWSENRAGGKGSEVDGAKLERASRLKWC